MCNSIKGGKSYERVDGERRLRNPSITVRPTTSNDTEWIASVLTKWWGSTSIVSRGRLIDATALPGFLAAWKNTTVGLVTYAITGRSCEIVTLNSLEPGKGIGACLVNEVKRVAEEARCTRLWVITTNDNTLALRFYQRHGFHLVAVHRNALERSRRLKKEIPRLGQDGIPLRDEIELEMTL